VATFRVETLDGGLAQIVIEGGILKDDHELWRALSSLSKSSPQAVIQMSGVSDSAQEFVDYLAELSARCRMKVVSQNAGITSQFVGAGVPVFPSVKSAQLSIAGEETIRQLLVKLRDVPILATDAYKLLAYLGDPNATFEELERMVKEMPGLVSQAIRLSNSSYFYRGKKVDTLANALTVLGFNNLRMLFLFNFHQSVMNMFSAQKEVIEHGRRCAALAEFIARSAKAPKDEYAKVWVGGLLHDIGGQALSFFFPEKYAAARKLMLDEAKPSFMAELVTFGTEHQTVGRILAQKWNFPDYLVNIIGDHHYLQAAGWNRVTLPVYCANNYLNEKEGIPAMAFYSKLVGYFMMFKADCPWEGEAIGAEFEKALSENKDSMFS